MFGSWKASLGLPFLFLVLLAALLVSLWWAIGSTQRGAGVPVGLGETDVTTRALAAAAREYTGTPAQVTVTRTTVEELGRFRCSNVGAMVSLMASPLQGKADACAPDSTLWVVSLRGLFQHGEATTDSVQVVLDRAGKVLAVDSGEMVAPGAAGY